MASERVALITGASSGVGQATARLLAQNGYRVFGTSRDPARATAIPNVTLLPLDVRVDESVATCVRALLDQAGQVDILVNNAGYELAGALEEISVEEAKAQFETNFFGVHRMVRAVLPHMRARREGQIIQISSEAGFIAVPFMAMYSATKFAVEGYTEGLRMEVRPFGIRVSQIEVGFLKTTMMQNRQLAAHPIEAYTPWRERALQAIRKAEEAAPGPDMVAAAVLKIVTSKRPRLRYMVGTEVNTDMLLRRLLPPAVFEWGVRRNFGLDGQGRQPDGRAVFEEAR